MKKTFKSLLTALILISLMAMAQITLAQGPPPPPSGDGAKGSSSNHAPGGTSGSPIGNGTLILIALAAAYGGRKAYSANKKGKQD